MHNLSDAEADYYFTQYPDVLNNYCGANRNNRNCARDHWRKYGCREGRNYHLPESCRYTLTDQEAICYIEQNHLNYRPVGNDLNNARNHWKTVGCVQNLNYNCPINNEISALNNSLTVSNNELKDLGADYKNYVDKTETKIEDILKLEVTSLPFVFHGVQHQNKTLETNLTEITNDKFTHNQSAFYSENQNERLDSFNTILFWVYYIVLFIFAGVLFGSKNLTLKLKLGLIGLFLLFPFFMVTVEYWVWFLGHYLMAFLYSKVFVV
jgi:hypothetical protein